MTREHFEAQLLAEAERWLGVPFRFRGATRYGADCMGVMVGALRGAGIAMPLGDGHPYETDWYLHDRTRNRYLEGLLNEGRETTRAKARPGDIICFWSRADTPKVVHTGLFLGGQSFLHAARGRGVAIDSLTTPQYRLMPKTWIRLHRVERQVED